MAESLFCGLAEDILSAGQAERKNHPGFCNIHGVLVENCPWRAKVKVRNNREVLKTLKGTSPSCCSCCLLNSENPCCPTACSSLKTKNLRTCNHRVDHGKQSNWCLTKIQLTNTQLFANQLETETQLTTLHLCHEHTKFFLQRHWASFVPEIYW